MVIDGNGERFLRVVLAYHVLIEFFLDLLRCQQMHFFRPIAFRIRVAEHRSFIEHRVTEHNTFIADADTGTCDQLLYLILCLAANYPKL